MFSNYLARLFRKKFCSSNKLQGGFGLVELLISVSIMVIVTGVVMVQQGAFNSAILLRSQAFEVALSVREVQQSAVSSLTSDGTNFRNTLGLHFNNTAGSNQQYTIFRDSDDDSYYDGGEAFGEQGILDQRFEIRAIRAPGAVSELSVVFVRPNFDALFYNSIGQVVTSSVEIDVARVDCVLASCIRTVEITSTGQISVQ